MSKMIVCFVKFILRANTHVFDVEINAPSIRFGYGKAEG